MTMFVCEHGQEEPIDTTGDTYGLEVTVDDFHRVQIL